MTLTVLLNGVAVHGPWAILATWLIFYTLKQARERESALMHYVDTLLLNLQDLADNIERLTDGMANIDKHVHELDNHVTALHSELDSVKGQSASPLTPQTGVNASRRNGDSDGAENILNASPFGDAPHGNA